MPEGGGQRSCERCCPWPVTRPGRLPGLRRAGSRDYWTTRQPFPDTGATHQNERATLHPELVDLILVTVKIQISSNLPPAWR